MDKPLFWNSRWLTPLRLALLVYALVLVGLGGYLFWPGPSPGTLRVDKVTLEQGGSSVRIVGDGFGADTRVSLGLDLSNLRHHLHTLPTFGRGGEMVRVEDLLYLVQAKQGLVIFDLADEKQPKRLGTIPLPGIGRTLAVADGIAYVGCHKAGLAIVDVANPTAPKMLTLLPDITMAQSLAPAPGRLYVGEFGGNVPASLVVVDVTDPEQPKVLRRTEISGAPLGLARWENRLLVAGDQDGLIGFSLAGDRPQELFRVPLGGQAHGLVVRGTLAYVVCGRAGLSVVELAGPQPRRIFQTPLVGVPIHVVAEGNRLYTGGVLSGLQIIDLGTPEQPRLLGQVGANGGILGVAMKGDLAYLSTTKEGVKVFDLSSPTLTTTGHHGWEKELPIALARTADLLLVGTAFKNLLVFKKNADDSIRKVGEIDLPASTRNIQVAGNHAYLQMHKFGLGKVDLAIPEKPSMVATFPWGSIPDEPYPFSGALSPSGQQGATTGPDSRLYFFQPDRGAELLLRPGPELPGRAEKLAWGEGRLYLILDVGRSVLAVDVHADGRTVVHPGFPLTVPMVKDLAVMGERLVLACGLEGLLVLDFSQPENPRLLAVAPLGLFADKVKLSGATAYVSNRNGGVQVVDLSDPARPVQGALFDDPVMINDFVISGDRLVLAAGNAGLLSAPLPKLLHPRQQTPQTLILDLPPIDVPGHYTLHLASGTQSLSLPGVLALGQR